MEVFSTERWRFFVQNSLCETLSREIVAVFKAALLRCSLPLSFFLSLLLFSPLCAAFYARFGKFHNAIDLWAWQKYFTYACALPRAGPQHKQDMSTSTSTQHTHTHTIHTLIIVDWVSVPFDPTSLLSHPHPLGTSMPQNLLTIHFRALGFINCFY